MPTETPPKKGKRNDVLIAIIGALTSIVVAWFGSRSIAGPAAKTAFEEQRTSKPSEKETLPTPPPSQNTQALGCEKLGVDQICWGQNPLLPAGPPHVRSFSFKFAKPFKSVPAVTTGINVVGSGYTFAVYKASVTETEYTGLLVENNSRNTDVPVSMSYTAIGEPR
jgi:hypothetical protein